MLVPTFLSDIPQRKKLESYIDYTHKVVSVEVLPDNWDIFEKLRIGNFTIVEFSDFTLQIQVNFESPSYISMSALHPDELVVTLL